MLADMKFRLRALFRRLEVEQELDDELRFHIEKETAKHRAAGVPRAEAERRARVAFGGVDRIRNDARDARGISAFDTIHQDLRYAWRGMKSKPGFTVAVVLTLALGIGANTAMFGIVDRLLFRPPAFLAEPDATHRVYLTRIANGREVRERHFAYTRYADLVERTAVFERLAAFAYRTVPVGTSERSSEMTIGAVSASYFDFFLARPELGRFFGEAEDVPPAGENVVVLGHAFWRTAFNASPDVLGQTVQIGPAQYTVIGVAPEGFRGMSTGNMPAAYVPITSLPRTPAYYQNYNWSWLQVVALRKPGVSVDAAHADLTAAYQWSWGKEGELVSRASWPSAAEVSARGRAEPVLVARGPDADANARIAAWLMGVAVIVLLIACANVANLMLARAVARRREIALRLALGVSRSRLVQQLLTESVFLAALGGAAGLAIAEVAGPILRTTLMGVRASEPVASDPRTLIFAAAVTLTVALLTGIAPLSHAVRENVGSALKAGAREGTYRRSRARTGLLHFQAALSVVLLVGAGLFVRSLLNVRSVELGYDVDPVALVYGNLRGVGVELAEPDQHALVQRLLEVAASAPGVRSVTPVLSVPFWSFESRGVPIVEGRDSLHLLGSYTLQVGNADYFATIGTRILRGRGFSADDRVGAPLVTVLSESMASAIWPGEDPIGRQMRFGGFDDALFTVAGVAQDLRGEAIHGEAEFWYYLPADQFTALEEESALSPQFFVRVDGRAEHHVETLRKRMQEEMPGASYVNATTLQELIAPQQQPWKLGATMFVAFGALALALAAIGLYSVIVYTVAQRSHEIGVRMALGASVRDVVRLVVGQGLAFAIVGIAAGTILSLLAGPWVEPLLFRQSARDPLIFAGVAITLVLVALAATLRPAIRATRVDPAASLRAE
jgi:putative ABC transport system permease protein